MDGRTRLIRHLADGRFHSGEALGKALGISRAAVWKQMRGLEALGLSVHSVRGRGYRLAEPLELLDPDRLRARLSPQGRQLLACLEVLDEIDSTNRHLMDRAGGGGRSGEAALAERQTAGRGRRGRGWYSPFAAHCYLSLLWRFGEAPLPSGLSLTAGVAAARALERLGVAGVRLKWPNDLSWEGRKLGGILIELAGESAGPCAAVAGVGINVRMPAGAEPAPIDQPWIDLVRIAGRAAPGRNAVAAGVLDELLVSLARFEREGFAPFRSEWERRDALAGRAVEVRSHDRVEHGRAVGVDEGGAFLVARGGETRRYVSGEVTVRAAP
ncbi:MAG: bifunctional biotin--[acetyl-CoA-carboxylase] ligase/biotin operon repressor BirA [Gammaproteobacteria bacterium]|nr:bifunctional biotin--[acetyl-CoA-carboxylase] ligase/biotin operon repressor BirA [Gammaproteobacteria bacterium]